MRLANKVALVTGGSRGIGRAIALAMAAEGAAVAVNYTSRPDAADEVVGLIKKSGGRAAAYKADVANQAEVEAMVAGVIKDLGGLHVLVNNSGICPFVDFFDIDEATWDRVQGVNTKGIFFAGQAAARWMKAHGGGKIVNVTSISGEKATDARQVPYCTSKAAANMLTKVMALALAPYKINVNAVLPGTIPTDINEAILAADNLAQKIADGTPLKTLGRPEDVAGAVIYFASSESDWTTGALLAVDGGVIA